MSTFPIDPVFTQPADQEVLQFLNEPQRLLISGTQSAGEFALMETTGVRGNTTPWHRHLRGTETFVVLEGEMQVDVGEQRATRRLQSGGVALLPREVPHGFIVLSPTARYLTLHTPSGFDAFVHDVSDVAQAQGAAPDRDTLVRLAADHGIEILGPGLRLPTA